MASDRKSGKAARAATKAERKRARRIVKVEVHLADAREIRAAVDTLIGTLERKLAGLQADGAAPPSPAAAPAAPSAPSAPAAKAKAPRRRGKAAPPA